MGWTFYHKPEHRTASQELAALCTCDNETRSMRVLESALVTMSVWYAAVETITKADNSRQVWAAVFLVSFKGEGGYEFGYKDMDETMGPRETGCPARILDLLTPTDSEYALIWRWDCRARLLAKEGHKLTPGARVTFTGQWNGFDTFIASQSVWRGKKEWRFTPADNPNCAPWNLRGWRTRIKSVEGAATVDPVTVLGPRPTTADERWEADHAHDWIARTAWGDGFEGVPTGRVTVRATCRAEPDRERFFDLDQADYRARQTPGKCIMLPTDREVDGSPTGRTTKQAASLGEVFASAADLANLFATAA